MKNEEVSDQSEVAHEEWNELISIGKSNYEFVDFFNNPSSPNKGLGGDDCIFGSPKVIYSKSS